MAEGLAILQKKHDDRRSGSRENTHTQTATYVQASEVTVSCQKSQREMKFEHVKKVHFFTFSHSISLLRDNFTTTIRCTHAFTIHLYQHV